MSPSTTWRRTPSTLHRQVGERAVILPEGHDVPLILSGPGAFVWRVLAEPGTVRDLAERLAEVADTDADTIEADLPTFLSELERAGAVVAA